MKRALQGNAQEDGGGTSGGSQETLKRPRKQKNKKGLEEEEGSCWECLPQEILLHIFQYLPLLDRAYASQVCVVANQQIGHQSVYSDVGLLHTDHYC